MIPFAVLDLAPINEGGSASESFARTLDLAQHAEAWGYHRYWMAEHHGMPGIASAATSVLIGRVAAATQHIRVGAGGIMLPNHAPMVIAEQFATLAALFPGRIDLGLGRAPGSDQATARALRRTLDSDPDAFPRDVVELMAYFDGTAPVHAVPCAGADVPIWILGSSLFGAQLAAALGLPYAFASHFAPAMLMEAITLYRARFRPSTRLATPYVMLGYNVFAADTDAEARYLASSWQQSFVRLRSGHPGRLPAPVEDYAESLPPNAQAMLANTMSCSAIGAPATIAQQIRTFIERTGADELIINGSMYDHAARLHSYELAAGLLRDTAG